MDILYKSINKLRKSFFQQSGFRHFFACYLICAPLSALAEAPAEENSDLFSMDLQQVMEIPVNIGSMGARTQDVRLTPGSITVMSADEIYNSGARDLGELLELIPGMQFSADNSGGSVLSFRGLGGRKLLRIDGQDMNELVYDTAQMLHHYSAAMIEKIEVIRGPGSIAYGGLAQSAVIEVTTKKPTEKKNGEMVLSVGATSEGKSRTLATGLLGAVKGSDFISVLVDVGEGVRGSGSFNDFYGNSYSMRDDAEYFPSFFNIGGKKGDFSVRLMRDNFSRENRDLYFVNAPYALRQDWLQDRGELQYSPQLSEDFRANFRINYLYDEPWTQDSEAARQLELSDPNSFTAAFGTVKVRKWVGTTDLVYEPSEAVSAVLGTSVFNESGKSLLIEGAPQDPLTRNNVAVYSQVTYKPSFMSINGGTRYEYNDHYNGKFVSRIAVAKAETNWHAKAQAVESFRSPGYSNTVGFLDPTGSASEIQPESTTAFELEVGHKLGSNTYLTTTIFDSETKDTITYFYDPSNGDSYGNFGNTGVRGFETMLRYVDTRFDVSLAYAYHRADNENPTFAPLDPEGNVLDDTRFGGVSPQMVTLRANWKISERFNLNSSVQYQGTKYVDTSVNEDDLLVTELEPQRYLWNTALAIKNVGVDKFDLQLGLYNILDEKIVYPASSYHAPVPIIGREVFLNASYRF